MSQTQPHPTRVAIIGVGNVGATFAYTLLLSGLAAEIVLIDANRARAEGEAMDLSHAVPFAHACRIWAGDYADCAGAIVTVIAAGANQKPGESRLDLVKRNTTIFHEIVPDVARHSSESILLIATNPVDVLTYVSWRLSGPSPLGDGRLSPPRERRPDVAHQRSTPIERSSVPAMGDDRNTSRGSPAASTE